MGRAFANSQGDWGSITGQVIPKTLQIVLDASLLNTQDYKVCFKGKIEPSRERNSIHLEVASTQDYKVCFKGKIEPSRERNSIHLVVANEKGAFESPSTAVAKFTYFNYLCLSPVDKGVTLRSTPNQFRSYAQIVNGVGIVFRRYWLFLLLEGFIIKQTMLTKISPRKCSMDLISTVNMTLSLSHTHTHTHTKLARMLEKKMYAVESLLKIVRRIFYG